MNRAAELFQTRPDKRAAAKRRRRRAAREILDQLRDYAPGALVLTLTGRGQR